MATDTDTLTRTERLIAWAALAIVLTMLNGCTWLLTSKHQVVVIERQNDTLQVTAVYYMAGDDYLLGLPAMMMRLTGLEPPAILQGTNATIDLRSAGELSGTHEGILVNATDQDIWYTPFIYGDEGSLPRNAPTEPARLQPDSAMRFLPKTHGEYRFGCKGKPREKETFSHSGGEGPKTAILGWITPTAPDACGTTQQGTRPQTEKPKQSVEPATSEAMDACSRGFEAAAQRYVEELNRPSARDPRHAGYLFFHGGAAGSFIYDNRDCFKEGAPRFSLTGPYSNHDGVRKVLKNNKATYERLNPKQ